MPLVRTVPDLARVCERMARAPSIAVDTEFVRDRTFYARLCLVQLATPDEHALVDPLAMSDLAPLRELLLAPGVVKVFHSGRQDLEIFHDLWSTVPAPIFDTQLAATILGFGDQVAYGALVRDVLGVSVQKSQTLTDWSRRPLSAAQIEYAAADVIHLVPLHQELARRLEQGGRADWLAEELRSLTDPALYRNDPDEAWKALRRSSSLSAAQRSVLREVAAWRERDARSRDLPRRWVLSDDSVVEVARRAPRTVAEMDDLRGIPAPELRRSGAAIVAAVAKGLAAPPDEAPAVERVARPSPRDLALADLFGCLVRLRAQESGVSASALATRAVLESVAQLGEAAEAPVLRGWRRAIVGEDLLALRDGRIKLVVQDGEVRIE